MRTLAGLIIHERNHKGSMVDEVTLAEVDIKYETNTNKGDSQKCRREDRGSLQFGECFRPSGL